MKYQLALIGETGMVLLGQDFSTTQDLAAVFAEKFIEIGEFCENHLNLCFCVECFMYNDGECECEKAR